MSINQSRSKFNLSVRISMKESQSLELNYFFPPYPSVLTVSQNLGGNSPQAEGCRLDNQTQASSCPHVLECESEDTALSPLKQIRNFVLTEQTRIFQPSMRQDENAMMTAIISNSILIT